jgi:uncharacterized protein DUF6907
MTLNISSQAPTLPAVACAPWCVDGAGHTDALYPEDQVCRGETVAVELARQPLVEVGEDSWRRDSVHLYLLRHAGASAPTVEMYRGELGESVSLTVDEAEALSAALLAAVRSARG